jgi:hypothetical protein
MVVENNSCVGDGSCYLMDWSSHIYSGSCIGMDACARLTSGTITKGATMGFCGNKGYLLGSMVTKFQ